MLIGGFLLFDGSLDIKVILEVFLQTFLAFFAILVFTRLLNKQQMAQLTFYDYVNGITFGSIAAALATDVQQRTWQHLLGLTLFAALTYLMSYLSLKSRPLRKLLEGEPTILIHNGKILEQNMAELRYNLDDLTSQLREKDCFSIADVEFAIAEPNGSLSVLLKTQKQPVTPVDLNIPTSYSGISTELIMDGKIIYPNLEQHNLDIKWLENELNKQGIYSVSEVVFACLDTAGNLYIDKKMDQLENIIDITDKENSNR
jgi:uncharacterized membrane protein YcaP (DUF421 family)